MSSGDLEALRALPAADLSAAYSAIEAGWMETLNAGMIGQLMTCPILDEQVMPELPIDVIRSGAAAGVDLLIGITDEEFKLIGLMLPSEDLDEAGVVARLDAEHGDGRRVYDTYHAARSARGDLRVSRVGAGLWGSGRLSGACLWCGSVGWSGSAWSGVRCAPAVGSSGAFGAAGAESAAVQASARLSSVSARRRL